MVGVLIDVVGWNEQFVTAEIHTNLQVSRFLPSPTGALTSRKCFLAACFFFDPERERASERERRLQRGLIFVDFVGRRGASERGRSLNGAAAGEES